MQHAMPLLAADVFSEPGTVKLIMGLLAAGFWVVTQVFGKKTAKPDQRLPPTRPRPPALPPTLPQSRRSPPPRSMPRPQRAPVAVRRSESMYKSTPAMPPRAAPMSTRPVAAPPMANPRDLPPEYHGLAANISRSLRDTSDGITRPPAAAAARILPRAEFLSALLQPRNLKKAYILNEILQPPVSMRGQAE